MDTNGDGTLDAAEVRSVMQSMGKKFTDAEFEEAMAEMDKDGSGALDFEEAFAWWHAQDPGAQMQLEQSVKGMKLELDELADESDRVAQALDNVRLANCPLSLLGKTLSVCLRVLAGAIGWRWRHEGAA